MQIKPNRSILEGKVNSVQRAPDGWGANVGFTVSSCKPAKGLDDFVQATPGSVLTLFAAEPGSLRPGKSYEITVSVLGGPQGERVVVEHARPKAR